MLTDLNELQQKIGVPFKDHSLIRQALIHSSYINENPSEHLGDNERMEFLGDALLNFTLTDRLYHDFPTLPEGKLTEIRISLIRQEKLAEKAAGLKLGNYLQMGKGEGHSGGRSRLNILADAFEALIAAIYLDQGLDCVRSFILGRFSRELHSIRSGKLAINYKAMLQELTQSGYKCLPCYEVISATGPDHDKLFHVSVSIHGSVIATGSGKSKKIAESEAARTALNKLSDKPAQPS